MVRAKNYEIMSTFVKVIQKKLWPLFSGHGVYVVYIKYLVVVPVKLDTPQRRRNYDHSCEHPSHDEYS